MTTFTVHYIYLATLFIPALMALLRFNKVTTMYHPILFFLWAIFLLESIQAILIRNSSSTVIPLNIQYLLEAFLICWQAKRWGAFNRRPQLYLLTLNALFGLWVFEILVIGDSWGNISWFRVLYSFTITLIAIEVLNRTMITERGPILRNGIALFSMALIFYYALACMMEIIMIVGQYATAKTIRDIYYFYIALSIIVNFVYTRAVLCIPRNTNYSLS